MELLRTPAAKVKEFWLTVTPCEDQEFNVTDTDEPAEPLSCGACGGRWAVKLVWVLGERQWYADWTPQNRSPDIGVVGQP